MAQQGDPTLGLNWPGLNNELTTDLGTAFGNMGAGNARDPFGGASFSGRGSSDPWNGRGFGGGGDPFNGASFGISGGDPFNGQDFGLFGWNDEQKRRGSRVDHNGAVAVGPGTAAANAAGLGSARWATLINQEAGRYSDAPGLAEVAQAVMELESRGNEQAQGVVVTQGAYKGQQAQGLMQIMPGNYPGVNLMDPKTNVQKGLEMLYARYKQYGDWDKAVASYFGAIDSNGNITNEMDDNKTPGTVYVATVNKHRAAIRAASASQSGAGVSPQMASIWGGGTGPISQGYAVISPGVDQKIYAYGKEYGLEAGHTGIDVAVKRGTKLYVPVGVTGVVQIAGGSGVFRDEDGGDPGNVPGKGELRILLSNGDILIMGHNSSVNVKVGQQVTGGQLVALSGSAAGDHLHLEVRRKNANGGYTLVDPRTYFAPPTVTPRAPAAGGGNLTP